MVSTPLSTLGGATLAISAFDVRLLEVSNGRNVYRPTLVLAETSLKDAATLTDIVLSIPDGDSFSIIVKGGTPMRVLAGQTWDLTRSPYYPAFIDIDTGSEVAAVRATVSFVDGAGVYRLRPFHEVPSTVRQQPARDAEGIDRSSIS